MNDPAAEPAHVATLLETWDETPALMGVRLSAPTVTAAHHAPGQFLTIDACTPIAIASAPGHGLELLVKRGGLAEEILAAHGPGDRFAVDGPSGHGYPLAQHAGRDLILLAAGSGIAPLRAVLQAVLDERARWGEVHLYYGQRDPAELACRREAGAWRAAGVQLVDVISGAATGWTGARGHVQDALREQPPPLGNAVAYVCGMAEMVADTSAALHDLGLPAGKIFLNY